ncbi:MAG: hypothetical protein KDI79_01130 [Anaerolineae bacterium]|nr:hypothetical protein [Anaerolineae bacterium]
MGLVCTKVTRKVICNHIGATGETCPFCGAKRIGYGGSYQMKLVEIVDMIMEVCQHTEQTGTICSKCGDVIMM